MNKLQLTGFIVLFVSALAILAENIIDSTENTLNFVNFVHGQLKLTNNPNIILVIGTTGVGKSTLIHCITTDCSRLLSIDNGVEYMVIDELDVGVGNITSTSVSRTLVPEAIIDSTQNLWYDCPGFGDTRNETVEIATTYLIKCVIENAKRVKIVLVVDFDSIVHGHNRDGFDRLLSRTTQLIKNTKTYENSFSMVITKVPSYKGHREIRDDNVKKSATVFMRAHRAILREKGSNAQKIYLIDALLGQNTSYPQISIFWRPGDEGYFNKIDKMMIGHQRIRESIMEHSSYTEMHKNDFGFPLTAEAMIKVTNMSEETVNSISSILHSINQRIQTGLQQKISAAEGYELKLELIKIGKNIIQSEFKMNADNSTELITLKQVTVLLNAIRLEFNVNSIDKVELNRIEWHTSNLNLLQSLVEIESFSFGNDLNLYLKGILDFFNDIENQIQTSITNDARQIIAYVSNTLATVDGQLFNGLKQKIDSTHDYQSKLDLLKLAKRHITSTDIADTLSRGKIQEFHNLIDAFNITNPSPNDLNLIERHEKYLNELKTIARTDINLPIRDWIATSSNTTNFISTELNWYSMLEKIYEFLASYEVQRNTNAYNVANLADWAQFNKTQGLTIAQNNFDEFVKRFTSVSQFEPIESRLDEINEILRTTLKSPVTYGCNGQTMIVKGNFVKSSDIQLKKCPLNMALTKINIFAVDTFYVDSDLNLNECTDIELHIFATTFYVQQAATFNLNGKHGKYQSPPNSNGLPGKPGNLGMNSGNFFALANRIRNGELLTVQQIAGDGGNGQNGSGNDDYSVTFDDSGDSYTNAGVWLNNGVRIYQERRVHKKSGGHLQVLTQEKSSHLNHFALVTGGNRIITEFLVTAAQCCGSTGIGGPGKQ